MNNFFKKSIDIVCLPTDNHGGAENILKQIVLGGFFNNEVHVLILRKQSTDFWSGMPSNIKVKYFDNVHHYTGFLKLFFYLLKASRNYNIDYVISSQSYINGLLGFCRKIKFLRCRFLILRESTTPFNRFSGLKLFLYKWPYLLGYSNANIIVCQSEVMKEKLLLPFPRLKNKAKVFHNPINLSEVNELGNIPPVMPIDSSTPFIVSAGRLIEVKGFDLLIKAFGEISSEHTNLTLIIFGEGTLRKELELLIKELQLKNKVLLPGHCKNIYPYFKLARLCVVSSHIEGFPNVLLQMMSQNGSVISSTCAGGIEDIPELPTFSPGDLSALKEKILQNLYLEKSVTNHRYDVYKNYLEERSLEKFIWKLKNAL